MTDVAAIWSKTGIPFDLAGYPGEKRIMYVINKGRTLNKVGMERRGEEFGQELDVLFDIASCKHVDGGIACSCSIKDKVPTTWRLFLADQRTQRQMLGVLKSDRYLTLRTAAQGRDSAEEESRQAVRYKVEEIERKKKEEHDRKKKADEAVAMLFSKAPIETEDIEIEETDIEQEVEDKSDDSDWEDIDENLPKRKYNCMSLKYFARECDRYGISDRAGAKIGNGLLKDMGLVNKEDMEKLICPTKLRRERRKWGVILEKEENALQLPQALYTDGKKVPTLVRQTVHTKVQVPGKTGKAAYRTVASTSNVLLVEDHYPVIAEVGGKYVTHLTPEQGTGRALAKEIVDVIRERNVDIRVLGMDGCSVNTGIHNGAIRMVEVMLGQVVQHVICGLQLVELMFWHILAVTDGVTKGPDRLSGPVGSTLNTNIWEEPVVAFLPIPGNVPELPEEVVKDLSRDQKLGYRYAQAIQTGVMPDDLVGQAIGPMITSRWNTTAVRVMCRYTRTRRPTRKLVRLTKAVLRMYFPGWFRFKCYPHIQEGAKNFFYLVEMTKELEEQDMLVAQGVLQYNAHWPHPENIIISMLSDEREEVRRRAVLYIMRARREFNPDENPRQFVQPEVNFQAANYFDLADLDNEPCTEPPLTMDMDLDTIMGAFREPLNLPPYPNNTQAVERLVRVVTEVAPKRAGYTSRHRMILKLLESRKMVPKFNTKKDDAKLQ